MSGDIDGMSYYETKWVGFGVHSHFGLLTRLVEDGEAGVEEKVWSPVVGPVFPQSLSPSVSMGCPFLLCNWVFSSTFSGSGNSRTTLPLENSQHSWGREAGLLIPGPSDTLAVLMWVSLAPCSCPGLSSHLATGAGARSTGKDMFPRVALLQ